MDTKLKLNFRLQLDNNTAEDSIMEIFYDRNSDKEFVGIAFTLNDKPISLTNGMGEEYFHLEKEQVGFMINFLKRMYDNMQ